MSRTFWFFLLFTLAGCSHSDPGPSPLGGPCAGNDDCADDLECLDALPGGSCSRHCDDECPDGGLCVDLAGEGWCFTPCAGPDDCRDGWACSLGHCDVPCSDDAECPPWARCDPDTRGCVANEGGPLGAPCADDAHCESGQCLFDGELGTCTEPCGGAPRCDANLVCGGVLEADLLRALCRPALGAGATGDICADGADCASGLCALGTCVYPCGQGGACEVGADCEDLTVDAAGTRERLDVCLPEAGPGVDIDDRGIIPTERGCVHVELEAPQDVVSFAIVAWTDTDGVLEPRNLVGPGHRRLIDDRGIGPIRVYDHERVITVLVPNSDLDDALPEPGHWEMDLCVREIEGEMLLDADVRVRVLVKAREDGVARDGHFTVNVHLAPNVYGPMTAANAHESPYIEDILDRLRHYYERQCNVTVGEVRFFDLSSSYGVIGSEEELDDMFESVSANAPVASVNVFIVRDLSGVAEWVAGIAGGLPGPPGIRGTPSSGVAIATQENGRVAGDTLSHELGHFFGLFHPTEMNGSTQDPISDTPTCTFDPEDPWSMGRCATISNMMFPTLTPFMEDVSDGQCFVVRGFQGL